MTLPADSYLFCNKNEPLECVLFSTLENYQMCQRLTPLLKTRKRYILDISVCKKELRLFASEKAVYTLNIDTKKQQATDDVINNALAHTYTTHK